MHAFLGTWLKTSPRLTLVAAAALLAAGPANAQFYEDAGGEAYFFGNIDGGDVFVGEVRAERADDYSPVALGRTNGGAIGDEVADDGVDHQVFVELYPQAYGNACYFEYSVDSLITWHFSAMAYDGPNGNNDVFMSVIPGAVYGADTQFAFHVLCEGPTAYGNTYHVTVPGNDGDDVYFYWDVRPDCDDADGDGYGVNGYLSCPNGDAIDCAPNDIDVHPGAAEAHNGVDDDCDGLADDGALPAEALIITEIMKDPAAVNDSVGEWFEIYNNTAVDMELMGLVVSDLGTNVFTVDTSLPVAAGTHAVLAESGDPGVNGGLTPDYVWTTTFDLGNTDDEIVLTFDGDELDRVVYDDPDWPDEAGEAMALSAPAYDTVLNNDPANWCAASAPYGDGDLGSPGGVNSTCCPDADGDGYLDDACGGGDCDDDDANVNPGAAEVDCDYIDNDCDGLLHPGEADDDGDGYDECQNDCDDADAAVNPGAAELPCDQLDNDCDGDLHPEEVDDDGDGFEECAGDCDDADAAVHPGAAEVDCDYIDNDCDGDLHPAEVDDDGDGVDECGGDCDDTDAGVSPLEVEDHNGVDDDCDGLVDQGALPAGALIITEIMKNPAAVADELGEWVEILNDTDVPMNLMGMEIADAGTNYHLVTAPLLIPPHDYALLGRDGDPGANGGVDLDYVFAADIQCGNGDDEIILIFGGVELDRVEFWDPDWPDTSGAALSLHIDFYDTVLNDDPENWCDAIDVFGAGDLGTPGEDNPVCCPDVDGDGFRDAACGGLDCDDADAAVNPDATEICDGQDNDCDPATDEGADADGDGATLCDGDCDDDEAAVFPGAAEICDSLDNDCDPATDELLDGDGDGFAVCDGDCDDAAADRFPGYAEACDGVDNDCDGAVPADEVDADGDGARVCHGDCDDADPITYPGAPEQCDGIDNDCDGDEDEDVDLDLDGDGYNACQGDCDNYDFFVNPGATEVCDGKDTDCDGSMSPDENDLDGDGFMPCEDDCDDLDATLTPEDADADGNSSCDGDCDDGDYTLNLLDNDGDGYHTCAGDCDDTDPGLDLDDIDGDGYSTCEGDCDDLDASSNPADDDGDGVTACDGDCDDGDPDVYPGAAEACDGADNDCNGVADDLDADGDGFFPLDCGGFDCDDSEAGINPDATEDCEDGVDNDCDDLVDAEDAEDCEPVGDDDDTVGDDDDDDVVGDDDDDDVVGDDDDDTNGGMLDDDDDDCSCDSSGERTGASALVAVLLMLGIVRRRIG